MWAEGRDPGVPHPVPHPTENLWPRPPEPGLGVGPGGAEDEDDDSSFGVLLGLSLPTASGECRGGEHPPPPQPRCLGRDAFWANPGIGEGTWVWRGRDTPKGVQGGDPGIREGDVCRVGDTRGSKEGTPTSWRGTQPCRRGPRYLGGASPGWGGSRGAAGGTLGRDGILGGGHTHTTTTPRPKHPGAGVLWGCSRSGELRDIARSVPAGSLGAALVTALGCIRPHDLWGGGHTLKSRGRRGIWGGGRDTHPEIGVLFEKKEHLEGGGLGGTTAGGFGRR